MIIETISSIATILGFGMQVFDKLGKDRLENEDDKLIYFLIQLSEKSTYLKNVHTQYHALYRGITALDNFLRNPQMPNLYKTSGNIPSNELLIVINDATLKEFSESIDMLLSEEMNQISIQIDFDKNESYKALKALKGDIAFKIKKIIESQNKIVKLHKQYCDFFSNLKILQDKNELSADDKDFILNNRRLTSTIYSNIIFDTDQALMYYLDIYSFVLTDIKLKRKF